MANPILRQKLAAGEFLIVSGVQDMIATAVTKRVGFDTINAGLPDAREQARSLSGGGLEYALEFAGSVPALGTCVPTRDIPRYLSLYRQGRLPADRLLSGTFRLEGINQAFDLLHEGKAIRQVVVFDPAP